MFTPEPLSQLPFSAAQEEFLADHKPNIKCKKISLTAYSTVSSLTLFHMGKERFLRESRKSCKYTKPVCVLSKTGFLAAAAKSAIVPLEFSFARNNITAA